MIQEMGAMKGHKKKAVKSPRKQSGGNGVREPGEIKTVADLRPDLKNANRGTQRGRGMLEKSLRDYGAGRSILTDKNGIIIAGNKVAEVAGQIDLPVREIRTKGNELVVVRRMDLDLEKDKAARELSIADNRVGQVSLDWDPDILKELSAEIDLGQFWVEDELSEVLKIVPDFQPVSEDEQGRLDQKKPIICPECGAEFTPK